MIILGTQTTQFAYNGDGVRTSKTVPGDTTEYVLDLAATLPVVISDTEAVYLYGLDVFAQQQWEEAPARPQPSPLLTGERAF
ncbi:MAG TPA: hypothetical protein VMW58_05505 [Anaerolineae bacterium]|nr:hypothetical protein [Anaerolineae bacterium]